MNRIIFLFLSVLLCACVQKTFRKTVVYTVVVHSKDSVQSVGLRGGDKPLSWDEDFPTQRAGDSLYMAVVTYLTGYKFTEVKFTCNGNMELNGQPNRKIVFASGDTTYVRARWDRVE